MEPSRTRSLVKALTWRALASLDTFLLGYFITGRPLAAASIAGGEVLTKFALYYLHERGWAAIDWGHRPSRVAAYASPEHAAAICALRGARLVA